MNSNEILKVVSTTSEYLDQLPVSYGQLIFVSDTRELYFDHLDGRIPYQQIIILRSENQRQGIVPVTGFYFVIETAVLWYFDNGTWSQINSTPNEQIYFGSFDSFPPQGKTNCLYIDGTDMYRWIDGNYVSISGSLKWTAF